MAQKQRNRLRGILTEYGITYSEIAGIIGLNVASVSTRMNGKVPFRIEECQRIVTYLNEKYQANVTIESVFG